MLTRNGGLRHPQWCLGGTDCLSGMHISRIRSVAQTGEEIIQVEEPQYWLVDLAQARALVPVLQDLLRIADTSLPPLA